jgi:hypothetical protein
MVDCVHGFSVFGNKEDVDKSGALRYNDICSFIP